MGKDMDSLFKVVGSGSGVKAGVLADEADEDSTGCESWAGAMTRGQARAIWAQECGDQAKAVGT